MTGTALEAIDKLNSSVIYLKEWAKLLDAFVKNKETDHKVFVDIANKIGQEGKELIELSNEMLMR